MEKLDFASMVNDYDLLILGENVDQFDGVSSINVTKFAKSYNPHLKVIFLEDALGKEIGQREIFDMIFKYKLSDDFDKKQIREGIRALAKDVEESLEDKVFATKL